VESMGRQGVESEAGLCVAASTVYALGKDYATEGKELHPAGEAAFARSHAPIGIAPTYFYAHQQRAFRSHRG
jgi:hypothetical protein